MIWLLMMAQAMGVPLPPADPEPLPPEPPTLPLRPTGPLARPCPKCGAPVGEACTQVYAHRYRKARLP